MKYILLGLLISFSAIAADIPQDDIGASKYNSMECVSQNNQMCINDVCLNSDQTDCQDNCMKLAQQKCQQQLN